MTAIDSVNDMFSVLLEKYPDGIANTSTAKYLAIRTYFADQLSIAEDSIYATGATTRISNFDTRLAQGNQRNRHNDLAIAFLKANVENTKDLDEDMKRLRASFSSTCEKFVNGQERGTVYDGVLGLVQLKGESFLRPLLFICVEDCSYKARMLQMFPGLDVREVSSIAPALVAPANDKEVQPEGGALITGELLSECQNDLELAGMRLPPGLLARYISALITKRFVLLAGLSGSGKTKLAMLVARWLSENDNQTVVVAVGSDWTSNENVLGYRDALNNERYCIPSNGALDIIIRAESDPGRPYFLIMDEMNLSHVERYFADLLSSFESGEPIALHSADSIIDGVPPSISVPKNLFIVGTVNVDETTYMFSPKVLDRANVIEFRVSVDDISAFLENPEALKESSVNGQGSHFASSFVNTAISSTSVLDSALSAGLDEAGYGKLNDDLRAAFSILSPIGAEFGYRVITEIRRFVSVHALVVGDGWDLESAIDAQFIQKILPKIHGSERRIRPVLDLLARYFEEAGYEMSLDKVKRMQARLREGYVSYLD